MGYYLNKTPGGVILPAQGKADAILANFPGSTELSHPPKEWHEGIVCVVQNGIFDAAAYAHDADELKIFKEPDMRPKRWLLVKNAKNYAK